MVKYISYKVYLSDDQKKKIQNAVKNKIEVTLRLQSNQPPNNELKLTQTQINHIKNNKNQITLSKSQLKQTGGFLPLLALVPAAIAAAKAVGLGAAGYLGHRAVQRLTKGEGLYLPGKKKP